MIELTIGPSQAAKPSAVRHSNEFSSRFYYRRLDIDERGCSMLTNSRPCRTTWGSGNKPSSPSRRSHAQVIGRAGHYLLFSTVRAIDRVTRIDTAICFL
jgi:hypothetical protein